MLIKNEMLKSWSNIRGPLWYNIVEHKSNDFLPPEEFLPLASPPSAPYFTLFLPNTDPIANPAKI
jgi:hypothetical protein